MSTLEVLSLSPRWSPETVPAGYGKEQPVSFVVNAGQSLAIVGDNGIGKTTLLHAIAGSVPYVSGYVRVGQTLLSPRDLFGRYSAGVAHVSQTAFFRCAFSWQECLDFVFARRAGIYNEDAIDDLHARLGRPTVLSRRQFDTVASIMCVPRVLLLDEVSVAWPEVEFLAVARMLLPRAAIVFVEHNLARVTRHADKILWLRGDRAPTIITRADAVGLAEIGSTVAGGDDDLAPGEDHPLWELIDWEESPHYQIGIAVRAGISADRRRDCAGDLFRRFPFLRRTRPAKSLSGGERVVLLWVLTEIGAGASMPPTLLYHVGQRYRQSVIDARRLWRSCQNA